MYSIGVNSTGPLDKMRMNGGAEPLKAYFRHLALQDTEKAIELINAENLRFPSLFVLRAEIKRLDLFSRLNIRNRHALEIVNGILAREDSGSGHFLSEYRQTACPVLAWMLETGYMDDGLNHPYDEVLEAAAILLAKKYKFRKALPILIEMIFSRHRRSSHIHDLVWAFFEACDPRSLFLVANRLCSPQRKDIELARKLLKFIPCIGLNPAADNVKQYVCAIQWLNENYPFLDYTGESFQQTHNPKPYALSMEAKYLCKTVSGSAEKAFRSLTGGESLLLEKFSGLTDDLKALLSDYSFLLYRQDMYLWDSWIHSPVSRQIEIAKAMTGGPQ